MYICPKFNKREIETTNSDGSTSKGRVYCDHTAKAIHKRSQGYLDARGPYQELLDSGGLDWRYRALAVLLGEEEGLNRLQGNQL